MRVNNSEFNNVSGEEDSVNDVLVCEDFGEVVQDDDEVAEVQWAGRHDGRVQPGASAAAAETARAQHLCGALLWPEVSTL